MRLIIVDGILNCNIFLIGFIVLIPHETEPILSVTIIMVIFPIIRMSLRIGILILSHDESSLKDIVETEVNEKKKILELNQLGIVDIYDHWNKFSLQNNHHEFDIITEREKSSNGRVIHSNQFFPSLLWILHYDNPEVEDFIYKIVRKKILFNE